MPTTDTTEEIVVPDYFDNPVGTFADYDCFDVDQHAQLIKQVHVDIRCFEFEEVTIGDATMTTLDGDEMDELDGMSMDDLTAHVYTIYDEEWTSNGTIALSAESTRNYWRTLEATLGASVITITSLAPTVDFSAFDDDDGVVSIAVPDYPLADIDATNSFFELTSNADGTFAGLATVSVAFEDMTYSGDELIFPATFLDALEDEIIGVRFIITGLGVATFVCSAIRILGSDWVTAPLDINTLTGRVVLPVTRDGQVGAPAFPVNVFVDPFVPTDWPILLRADTPSSADDPRPIDISEMLVFNTGSMIGDGEVILYLREAAFDSMTQLDLDEGGTGPTTQEELDALGVPPDYGAALYLARTQAGLDDITQEALDLVLQTDLEATPDYFSASWIQVGLAWSGATATVTLEDTEGVTFTYDTFSLTAQTSYALDVQLEENTLRVRVHTLSAIDQVGVEIFDSYAIINSSFLPRRAGRVGWWAALEDGDAFLDSIRTYSLNFSEYRSQPLRSISPVSGTQVFFGGSPAREHFTGIDGVNGAIASTDTAQSDSGRSYKIETDGESPLQGLHTNAVHISDFRNTRISFDALLPADGEVELWAFLEEEQFGSITEFNLGRIDGGRWESFEVSLSDLHGVLLPGHYRVTLVQDVRLRATWYIDHFSIRDLSLAWSARGSQGDPWGDSGEGWIDLHEMVNSQTAGVLFYERGYEMQARCLALRSDASLGNVKLLPKYADLGRLVWRDESAPVVESDPVITLLDLGVTPDGDEYYSLSVGEGYAYVEWDLDDGEVALGTRVRHAYSTGSYTPSVSVVSSYGNRFLIVSPSPIVVP